MSDEKYSFLDEEVVDDVVPEAQAEAIPETVVTPEPPAPVVPTTTEPEATHVPLAALKAEREKRQQYERELQAYRQQPQQQQVAPNFYEAPEEYVAQIEQRAVQRMNAALEADLRENNPDYDEVMDELKAYAQENPAVLHQIFSSPNPPRAAYKLGKQVRELAAMKDPDQYRKGIEAEVRAKVEAEYAAKESARVAAAAAIPPDLSAARSARDQEVTEDDSLDSILASRKKK